LDATANLIRNGRAEVELNTLAEYQGRIERKK
jgi:hypothetical protein